MIRFKCGLLLVVMLAGSITLAADPARVQPFSIVGKWQVHRIILVDEKGRFNCDRNTDGVSVVFTDDQILTFKKASNVPDEAGDWKMVAASTSRERVVKITLANVEVLCLVRFEGNCLWLCCHPEMGMTEPAFFGAKNSRMIVLVPSQADRLVSAYPRPPRKPPRERANDE